LSHSITDVYLGNYRAVEALAREYGFSFYYFWPPHLSKGKKALTNEEQAFKQELDPALLRLFDEVYATVEARVSPEYTHLFVLSDLFDRCESLIWIDDVHTTPVGNQMIAERMLQVIGEHESLQHMNHSRISKEAEYEP
jgi:lysophospholipase L1-like esterase